MKEYTFRLYDNFLPNPDVIKKTNVIVNFKYCNLSELCWVDEEFNDNVFNLPNWIIYFDLSYNSIYALYKGSSHDYVLPKNLQILNLSFNKLDFIPDNIPKQLVALNVSNNTLKYIPKLPFSTKVINASHNTLKWFDLELPNLEKLNLSHNHIYYFRFDRLKDNLQFLDLTGNQLKMIDGDIFPKSLKVLRLGENRIEHIPELPEGLVELDVNDNKLKKIPNYPIELKVLDVGSNYLEILDDALMGCEGLEKLNYEKNENIEISFDLLKWIDKQFHKMHQNEKEIDLKGLYSQNYEEIQTVYKDSQNAHNLKIRNDIINSMTRIVKNDDKPSVTFEECCEGLKNMFKLEDTCEILLKSDFGEVILDNVSYGLADFFPYLYNRIIGHENCETLVGILEDEIQNTKAVCFSGRIEAYVSALASFYDDINYSPSINDQILAKIELIKNKLHKDRIPSDSLNYQVEMRYYMEQALEEISVNKANWLIPIDEIIEELVATLEVHYEKDIEDVIEIIKMRKLMREYFKRFFLHAENTQKNTL